MKTKNELRKRIQKQKSAVLIVNTHSRRGERMFFEALRILSERGITITASYPVNDPQRLPEVVKEAIRRRGDLVIIGGGDGTISSVIDYFAYKDAVLGFLPLGTGNSFARSLQIPLDLTGAIDVIANGNVIEIDLGKVNGDYFANIMSIGFPAEVARYTSRKLKKILGPLSYGLIGLRYFFITQKFRCELIMESKTEIVNTHHVFIANGNFYGITPIGTQDQPDSQSLYILTMNMINRWKMLYFWTLFFFGKHKLLSGVKSFTVKKVKIITDPPRYIDVDGERTTQTPATVEIATHAIKILAPISDTDRT